jgi:hypothetical protein
MCTKGFFTIISKLNFELRVLEVFFFFFFWYKLGISHIL